MNFNEFKKGKLPGFWVSVGLIFLSILIAIIYIACFVGTEEMNYFAFTFLLIGAIGGAVLIVLKKYDIATYVIGACVFIALLFYIYAVYYYVSVVMVGIDLDHFSAEFIVTTILLVIATIAGIANIFLPQVKTEDVALKESEEN